MGAIFVIVRFYRGHGPLLQGIYPTSHDDEADRHPGAITIRSSNTKPDRSLRGVVVIADPAHHGLLGAVVRLYLGVGQS
jgi:hypothetical protein